MQVKRDDAQCGYDQYDCLVKSENGCGRYGYGFLIRNDRVMNDYVRSGHEYEFLDNFLWLSWRK